MKLQDIKDDIKSNLREKADAYKKSIDNWVQY